MCIKNTNLFIASLINCLTLGKVDLKRVKKMRKRSYRKFDDDFKLLVVSQVLHGEKSKYRVCKENTLSESVLEKWILKFAPAKSRSRSEMSTTAAEQEELALLRKQFEEIQKELKRERMRADFYQMMVEVAEEELKVPIRKKAGTKQ
jgi:transposase-like protein